MPRVYDGGGSARLFDTSVLQQGLRDLGRAKSEQQRIRAEREARTENARRFEITNARATTQAAQSAELFDLRKQEHADSVNARVTSADMWGQTEVGRLPTAGVLGANEFGPMPLDVERREQQETMIAMRRTMLDSIPANQHAGYFDRWRQEDALTDDIQDAGDFMQQVDQMLGGGVFGDHCSPISDTTVVSSLSAGVDHIEHVVTQIPYALVGGTAATILYFAAGLMIGERMRQASTMAHSQAAGAAGMPTDPGQLSSTSF